MSANHVPKLPSKLPECLAALQTIRGGFVDEYALQERVAAMMPGIHIDAERDAAATLTRIGLGGEAWQWEREKVLTRNERIDFMAYCAHAGGVIRYGIECKVRNGGMATWRQMQRYAAHADILILISTVPLRERHDYFTHENRIVPCFTFETWMNF